MKLKVTVIEAREGGVCAVVDAGAKAAMYAKAGETIEVECNESIEFRYAKPDEAPLPKAKHEQKAKAKPENPETL